MPLDFASLDALNSHENGPTTAPSKSTQKMPKTAVERQIDALKKDVREAKKELAEGLEKYGARVRKANPLELRLLDSAEQGEDIHVLFFIAVKALEAYTDSPFYYGLLAKFMAKYYQTAPIQNSEQEAQETEDSSTVCPNQDA